ncbi:hypothetical protein IWX49DRAFT_562056 [Phyllosticta citricarpa]
MAGKSQPKTAIVIGAGIGGVAASARLAKAGYKVTVVEKNDFTGGRLSTISHDGFRFDQGPSLLLLPHFFAETFHDLGTSLEAEGVRLLKCEPNYNLWFGDGQSFELSTDLARMKTEIEKWEGKDGFSRYLDFLHESHAHYELAVAYVLRRNFTSVLSMLRWDFLKHLIELHPFESIYARAARYFWTERLRRVFTFASMYMGMSPFDAPGTYSLLQYTELAEGIWYPEGGFHKVVEALVSVGRRLGVDYRLSTPVSKVLLSPDNATATGVQLESGEKLSADVVVVNADLVYAYNNLLPQTPYSRALASRPHSCSSISFYWALDRKIPELKPHNIFLADEYRESFDSIFKHHLIPSAPSFYVNVPSRIDASAAPAGKDSVVVLVPVGHLHDESSPVPAPSTPNASGTPATAIQDWPAMQALARRTILSTIAARTGIDLTPHIVHESTNTPRTWASSFHLHRGAILGLAHDFFDVLCFRPKTRHELPSPATVSVLRLLERVGLAGGRMADVAGAVAAAVAPGRGVRGLYFVGASTHPGTGVPIVLAGAKVTVDGVLADRGETAPWKAKGDEVFGRARGEGSGIDRVEGGAAMEGWMWVLVLLAGVVVAAVFVLFGAAGSGGLRLSGDW